MVAAPEIEIRRRFDHLAESYDRRWPQYVADTARETLARVDLTGGRAILDVGCGTGVLLEAIARRQAESREAGGQPDARTVGVDLSPGMLAVARGRLGPRADLVVGDALRLPFPSGTFDLALSASTLHHWRDPVSTLHEIRRVLRPAGRITITDWCADRRIARLRDRVLRLFEPAHFRAHRSAELATMLEAAGFRDVRIERWRSGWRWNLMTGTARVSAAIPSDSP